MRRLNRIAAIAAGISLAACGGGGDTTGREGPAIAEATAHLNSAKVPVTKAYEARRIDPVVTNLPPGHMAWPSYSFPPTANPPISTTVPADAKYISRITYNSAASSIASVVVILTGTGNPNLDGKFLGMFGTGQTDGTVTWHCGTSTAMTSTAPGAVQAMYPYLPDYCQN